MSDPEKVERLTRKMADAVDASPLGVLVDAALRPYAELLVEARETLKGSIEWIGNDGRALLSKLEAL